MNKAADGRIIWTEYDVRERLRKYNEDDSLYDCSAVQMSAIKYGYSSNDDGIAKRIYRLLKRAELDKAMEKALLLPPGEKIKTRKQEEQVRLYYLLRLIYIYDLGIRTTSFLLNRHRSTVARQEERAIGLVTGWLNRSDKKAPKEGQQAFSPHIKCPACKEYLEVEIPQKGYGRTCPCGQDLIYDGETWVKEKRQ